jgi:hypothetical protein
MAQKFPFKVTVSKDTDYDYNAQHCQETIDYLEQVGVKKSNINPLYCDNQVVDFYQLPNNVTVLTRKDLDLYIRAFEKMGVEDYVQHHWKSSPHLVEPFNNIKTRDFFNKLFDEVK